MGLDIILALNMHWFQVRRSSKTCFCLQFALKLMVLLFNWYRPIEENFSWRSCHRHLADVVRSRQSSREWWWLPNDLVRRKAWKQTVLGNANSRGHENSLKLNIPRPGVKSGHRFLDLNDGNDYRGRNRILSGRHFNISVWNVSFITLQSSPMLNRRGRTYFFRDQ